MTTTDATNGPWPPGPPKGAKDIGYYPQISVTKKGAIGGGLVRSGNGGRGQGRQRQYSVLFASAVFLVKLCLVRTHRIVVQEGEGGERALASELAARAIGGECVPVPSPRFVVACKRGMRGCGWGLGDLWTSWGLSTRRGVEYSIRASQHLSHPPSRNLRSCGEGQDRGWETFGLLGA